MPTQTYASPLSIHQATRDQAILNLASQGISTYKIAEKVELSPSRVQQVLRTDDAQEILKNVCIKYLSKADDIADRFLQLTEDEDRAIRLKAIQEYHRITGLTPSHAPSTIIQQVFADCRQQSVGLDHYKEYLEFVMARQAGKLEEGGETIDEDTGEIDVTIGNDEG